MSIRKKPFVPNEHYHIYNRGNSKQKIFHDHKDYDRFISLLYACNSENNFRIQALNKDQSLYGFERGTLLVDIGAYVLMPNHFHILITQTEKGDISKFMQKISTAYVMYYNKKYNRTGSLFEGKFKAEHLDDDNYLKYIFSYIHLNPVKLIDKDWKENGIRNKKEVLDYLGKCQHSSYFDYLGKNRVQNNILNRDAFPDYFPTPKDFSREIFEWISFNETV
ncbi:transposase [Patescibacteria group bacterium]|nr:transposase [Patescibacteria group bacterium]